MRDSTTSGGHRTIGHRESKLSKQLVSYLASHGNIEQHALDQAFALAEETGEDVARILQRSGTVSDRDLASAISELSDLPLLKESDYPDTPACASRVSTKFMIDNFVFPIADHDEFVDIAAAFPHDGFVIDALQMAIGKRVLSKVGLASDIRNAINRLYQSPNAELDTIRTDLANEADGSVDIEHLRDLASEAPVVRFVTYLISEAVDSRASDIHLEPFEFELRVRYRIDGLLQTIDSPPSDNVAAVVSRIKLLAGMDIAERRLPQDGRIVTRVQGKAIDLRVSTVPTVHGESVVLRLLDKSATPLELDELGFDPTISGSIRNCVENTHGIFLVTGPTGSGKSTTLYAALSELNVEQRKIITVEDPVEYQLYGINQIQVKPKIDLAFANALRSIMRQDPDVIMIGEMRDFETAQIAVQSALTGHLVLSTLHTNDAAGSVTRLLDMGIEPYLVTSTLLAVLAQRLARRICPQCREPYTPLKSVLNELSAAAVRETDTLYRSVGCGACDQHGYLGRVVIAEFMSMSDAVREHILNRGDATQIRNAAIAAGMRAIAQDGFTKASNGITTIEEIIRITQDAVQ